MFLLSRSDPSMGPCAGVRRSRQSGFTLIEVMVVIAIIAGVLAVASSSLMSSGTKMRASVRKLAILPREIRNIARLYNMTVRLAIVIDDDKGHSYWVESAPGNVLLMTEEQEFELERLTTAQREAKETHKTNFSLEKRVTRQAVELPRGLYFGHVELTSRKEPVSQGAAYVHFFPQGLAEQAAIHITDRESLNWTITINPLTGQARVFERKLELKDLRN